MGLATKDKRLLDALPAALAGLLDVPVGEVAIHSGSEAGVDLVVSVVGHTFAVEWSASPTAGPVAARAAKAAQRAKDLARRVVPLVAVPFMGEAGRHACDAARVAWLSRNDIATKLGIHPNTVSKIANRVGIKFRKESWRP
jgi:hypothetical protein